MSASWGVKSEPRRPLPRLRIRLLVEIPPKRGPFFDSLRVALGPAGRPLPIERKLGRFSFLPICVSAVLHAAVLALLFVLAGIHQDIPVVVENKPEKFMLIYTPATSLLPMEDSGPPAAGAEGTSGGSEAFHREQTVVITRTSMVTPSMMETPKLMLPQARHAAANLLAVPMTPSPVVPVLEAPVELTPQASRIPRVSRGSEPKIAAADVSRLQLKRGSVPDVDSSALAALTKLSEKSDVTLAPAPRPAIPKRTTIEIAASPVTDTQIPLAAETPVPEPSQIVDAAPALSPSQIVVSVKPGQAIAAPASSVAGSLAMSPKGRAQDGMGKEEGGTGTGRGAGPGSTTPGAGLSNREAGSGRSPAGGEGTSSGSGKGATQSIPGVTIRGGVITLDSFGPKVVAGTKSTRVDSTAARKAAPITVIATSRSGGGLNAYGVFKNRVVYTVYLNAKGEQVVLQFAAQDADAASSTTLTPPDPINTEMPSAHPDTGILLGCVLDATGHLQNVHSIKGGALAQALEEAVRHWSFHPVLNGDQPVNVDALIGIGVGVR
jgi:hypothetical protein